MKEMMIIAAMGLMLSDAVWAGLGKSDVTPVQLRCEYLENPLGIDTAKPRLSWQIEATARGEMQQAAQIIVASSKAKIDANIGDLWSATLKSDQSVNVEYKGKPLVSCQQYYWKVNVTCRQGVSRWSEPAWFATGMLNASDWAAASWIGMASADDHECPWLRKTFTLNQIPEMALASIGSIGYHELYVNGKKVGDAVLAPSESNLRKRVLYVTYDIKSYLKPGNNVIALWLAPGWSMFVGVNPVMDFQLAKKTLCIGKVTFSSGVAVIVTDNTWKCARSSTTHLGKWTNSNFGGDRIDARNHIADWNDTGLNDASWENATAYAVERALSPDLAPPNRPVETITPVSIIRIGEKKYKIDMGRLYTGWVEAALKNGTAGSNVTITVSSWNGRECEHNQLDEYIFDNSGQGTFCNRFSYHEIRYVVISGITNAPALQDIKGYRVGNDFKRTGGFDCSNDLLKKIYDYNLNTFVNLTTGAATSDCPHRERLGYGEVAQGYTETCLNNYEMGGFYTLLAQNWRDVQDPDGYIPHTVPTIDGGGGPAWSGGIIAIPWEVYLTYGDTRILEKTYPEMKKWLAFLDTKDNADSLLQPFGGGWGFLGDWLTPHGSEGSGSPEALLFNNCYYLYVTRIMSHIADVLKNTDDGIQYRAKAVAISDALNKRFFNPDGNFYIDTKQTHLLMPLMANAVPATSVTNIMLNLEKEILVTKNGHLDVGDPSIYYMTKYLTENGRSDLIFTYANQTTYPSYGYFISKGLDTWPEDWRGNPGSSLMHSCYPGIGAWFQEGLAGIRLDPAAPSFKHFIIKPAIVGDLTWVTAHVGSMYGRIVSNWKREAGQLTMEMTIPPNTTATVYVPAKNGATVTESGKPAAQADGVKFLRMENGAAVYEVGSGYYQWNSVF